MKLTLNHILLSILVLLFLFIVVISLFIAQKQREAQEDTFVEYGNQSTFQKTKKDYTSEYASFTALGKIRITTKPTEKNPNGVPAVITPWLSYKKDDVEFLEELKRKVPKTQSTIKLWFSYYTYEELKKMGDEKIKTELLTVLNENFVLNKIDAIYFSEFVFLE